MVAAKLEKGERDLKQVRVLHIVGDMDLGGAETMIMNLYRHIDRDAVQFDFLEYAEQDSFYDPEIRELGGVIHRISDAGSYKQRLNRHVDFFRQHPEYTIIHLHSSGATGMQAGILKEAKKLGISTRILHCHTVKLPLEHPSRVADLKHEAIKRLSTKDATDYFACSQEAANFLFTRRVAEKKAMLLYNPIDAQQYRFDSQTRSSVRAELGIGHETVVIGHVGRFDSVKNHGFLLEVFFDFVKKEENSLLLICGDGKEKESFIQKAQELGVRDKVVCLGLRKDVPRVMQAMDVFVFPSLFEGLGIAVVEAQAAGLPVVASDRVPPAAVVTDLVIRLPLELGTRRWAETVRDSLKTQREDTYVQFQNTPYDIRQTASRLQAFYLQKGIS